MKHWAPDEALGPLLEGCPVLRDVTVRCVFLVGFERADWV